MAEFANEQVLLFDLFFKGQGALEIFLRLVQGGFGRGVCLFGGLDLFPEIVDLRFVGFDRLFEFSFPHCRMVSRS